MATQRIYKQTTILNARAAGLKNLWEPSTSFQGKAQDKPSYLFSFIVPKTRGHWSEEPAFANFTACAQELYQQVLAHIPFPQIVWPVKDGDAPPEYGKPPIEWCKGHWFVSGSSSSPIETNVVQNGVPVKIMNRTLVKPGDFCSVGGALAQKTNMPNGVKIFINSVLFTAPGEEIAVGNSISGAELMAQAKAQGLNVTGFGSGGPGTGFGVSQQPNLPTPSPAFGATPLQQQPVPNFGGAPAPLQPPQGQFATPGGFAPPTGFPPR
jgi:hypothetical protein